MKTTLLLLLILSSSVFTVKAQDSPKIDFTSDVLDYGDIHQGSNGLRVFEFKNSGNAPLIIKEVASSCECLVTTKPKESIAPGERGEIEIKYDTKKVGPIRRTITVYSNAEKSTMALKIKGRVLED